MSIIRGVKDRRFKFVQLLNEMFENPELSLKAKGFIGYCLTKKDTWKFHVKHLCSVLKEGEKAIHAVITECIELGYAYRYQTRGKKGQFNDWETVVSDSKEEIIQIKKEIESDPDFKIISPQPYYRHADKRDAEKVAHSNTDYSNTGKEQQQYIEEALPKEEPIALDDVSPSAAVFSKEEESKQERPKKVSLPSKAKIAKREYSAPEPFYAKPKTVPEPIPEQFELFVPPEQLPERPNSIPKFLADFEIDPDPAIDLTEKRQILARYTHETIEKAVLFVIANLSKIKSTKVAYLKYACEKGLSAQESKPKLSTLEELKIYFEPYAKYNGATCYMNEIGIVFTRGLKNGEVKFDKYFSWERVAFECEKFGIKFIKDGKHNKHRDPQ